MRKKTGIFLTLLLVISMINFVSSDSNAFEKSAETIKEVLEATLGLLSPFFEKLIGDYSSSEFFFSKILLLILLILVIKAVLEKTPFGEDSRIRMVLSIVISILAIRFINENDFFEAIFIQYGALGISITTIVPMVIFFYFIHNTRIKTFGRKVFWAIYGITIIAIWISKFNEINEVANWIYGLTIFAVIILIFADKQIHSYLGLSELKSFQRRDTNKHIRKLKRDIHDLGEDYERGIIENKEYKKNREDLEKMIKQLLEE